MRHGLVLLAIWLSAGVAVALGAERQLTLDVEEVSPTNLASPLHTTISYNAQARTITRHPRSVVVGELYMTEGRAAIVGDSADLVAQLAGILERQPDWTLQIEAFADERGTEAYSLIAGEERSRLVAAALTRMGVKSFTLASYGQARPLCGEGSIGCWEENLRITQAMQWFGAASPESGYLLRMRFQTPDETKPAALQGQNTAFLQRIHQAERQVP